MYDVAIATSTYFGLYGNVPDTEYRRTMFRNLVDSMMELDIGGRQVCWVIGDDCSPSGPPQGIPVPFDVYVLTRDKNIGQPKHYLATVNAARERANWVLVVDDDGIISPQCLNRLFALVEKYPLADCYSAYNSKYHQTKEVFDDHVLKHSATEHGRFFRAPWSGFGSTQHPIPTLRPSGIQHCGKYGLNGTEDDYDPEYVDGRDSALTLAGRG